MNNAYEIAKDYIGLHEVRDREALMKLFKTAGFNVNPAVTPWCAYFINAVEKLAGNPGTNSPLARSFLNYGDVVEVPEKGDIVVIRRGTHSWQGHVGYFSEFVQINSAGYVRVLGGNQGNSVEYNLYLVDDVLGYRRFTHKKKAKNTASVGSTAGVQRLNGQKN